MGRNLSATCLVLSCTSPVECHRVAECLAHPGTGTWSGNAMAFTCGFGTLVPGDIDYYVVFIIHYYLLIIISYLSYIEWLLFMPIY